TARCRRCHAASRAGRLGMIVRERPPRARKATRAPAEGMRRKSGPCSGENFFRYGLKPGTNFCPAKYFLLAFAPLLSLFQGDREYEDLAGAAKRCEVSFFFVSRRALHLMCQNLRRRETRPESLLSASKSPDAGYLLTLMRSNKTVYSVSGVNISVG